MVSRAQWLLEEGMAAGRDLADTATAAGLRALSHDPAVVMEMEMSRRLNDAAAGLTAKGWPAEDVSLWRGGVMIGVGLRMKDLANG
ncbi:hypothetical protein SAMN02799631_05888 [Methylobacterium sp. 174MFSha1.1]|uniref:hypothetical protein n=1 Tax=Methylobacterium sp. 174MFSha1.1 TaxID=1502749 RepID=UPI0008E65864|nr:hypothetical protein [Methylobacterium sp. 174MFSha1.1]SFV14508.1 hypothetical protein SAMN02799631_05888 [Methylobacterium sp. 174MFSha1.1]